MAHERRKSWGWGKRSGRDTGILHASAVELRGPPEDAVVRVIDRAVQKYGPQDWSTWECRAEPSRRPAAQT